VILQLILRTKKSGFIPRIYKIIIVYSLLPNQETIKLFLGVIVERQKACY
jgi:hypothetical protein